MLAEIAPSLVAEAGPPNEAAARKQLIRLAVRQVSPSRAAKALVKYLQRTPVYAAGGGQRSTTMLAIKVLLELAVRQTTRRHIPRLGEMLRAALGREPALVSGVLGLLERSARARVTAMFASYNAGAFATAVELWARRSRKPIAKPVLRGARAELPRLQRLHQAAAAAALRELELLAIVGRLEPVGTELVLLRVSDAIERAAAVSRRLRLEGWRWYQVKYPSTKLVGQAQWYLRRRGQLAGKPRALANLDRYTKQVVKDYVAYQANPASTDALLARHGVIRDRTLRNGLQQLPSLHRDVAALEPGDRWLVYFYALSHLENGVGVFSAERVVRAALLPVRRFKVNPSAFGIGTSSSPDTYHGHGRGRFDVDAPAGAPITAVARPNLDLRRHGIGVLTLVRSKVHTVWPAGAREADREALRKIAYGLLGRHGPRGDKAVTALRTATSMTGLKPRGQDGKRVVAGLVHRGGIHGSSLSFDTELRALKKLLDAELDKDATLDAIRVSGKPAVLRDTASVASGWFGSRTPIDFSSVTASKADATRAIYRAVARVIAGDNPFTVAVRAFLVKHVRDRHDIGWSGPAVAVAHEYRDASGATWTVVVRYLHMRRVDVRSGQAVTTGLVGGMGTRLGEVGGAGNSISPHAHIELPLYRGTPTFRSVPRMWVHPWDFFPALATR